MLRGCILARGQGAGQGVPRNLKKARDLFTLAAEPGDANAAKGLEMVNQAIQHECPLLGKRVVITGTSREDLNGQAGVATSFDHARDRYVVELDDDDAGEKEKGKMKIKPENLVLVGRKERKGKRK